MSSTHPTEKASRLNSHSTLSTKRRTNTLALSLDSKALLYTSYMSFLTNGGLFIPTSKKLFRVGDEVFISLKLEDGKKYPVAGKVVWITPSGAQDNRRSGIGIHFTYDDRAREVKYIIERILSGVLGSSRQTHTL